ncbi:MAG: HNH endonuclease [Candidatus Dormibacteraeota bacterium]|nr:HNH endonuclease [Candidatus Dormibacteraeota bacterium]
MAESESPLELIRRGFERLPGWMARQPDEACGPAAIELREFSDRSEANQAEALRRFEKSGAWASDGSLSIVAWLRSHGKLSGGAAMERVAIARQLAQLPQTEKAFQRGELGYQHVAIMTRTAEHVGIAAVQKAESTLLAQAQSHDPGQFVTIAKEFEHRTDAEAALRESNRAFGRRCLHLSEPRDGLVHLDGLLDAEGGATLKTALDKLMPPPSKTDDRTAEQRRADAMVDLARTALSGGKLGSTGGQRPHLVITAGVDTLAGVPGAVPARIDGVGPIPVETAERHAYDATVSWLLGKAEFESETNHAHRQIPPSTRRALVARDRECVFHGCHRPAGWCDGHHLVFWSRGGETKLDNLALVCGRHHRMLHEEGWTLERVGGRWTTKPPDGRASPHARSA